MIKRVFRTFGEVVKAGSMVIEGTGFVAATFRSVLSMILLALRPNYPFKIFASIEDGLAFGLITSTPPTSRCPTLDRSSNE